MTTSYGTLPTSEQAVPAVEQSNEGDEVHDVDCFPPQVNSFRRWIAESIESKTAHATILALTLMDIILVILQIGASLLHLDETEKEHFLLEIFAHLSLAIVSIFMLEIVFKFFAFGPQHFYKGPHWFLHLADALIIITSFFLEILTSGAEQELGSLLIIFRLWRVIKLTGTVAIETIEVADHAEVQKRDQKIKQLELQLAESNKELERLRSLHGDQA